MASETRLKEIKEKATKAGLGAEFDEMIRDLIAREQRAIDAEKVVESLSNILRAIGVGLGMSPDLPPTHFAQLPQQVRHVKAQTQSGAITIRAESIKAWVRGYLDGIDFDVPDETLSPEATVRFVVMELRKRVAVERVKAIDPEPEPAPGGKKKARSKK